MVIPLLYLVPHVFYQTYHRYPRHFVIGYLAMGAVVLLAWADGHRRRNPARDAPGPAASVEGVRT